MGAGFGVSLGLELKRSAMRAEQAHTRGARCYGAAPMGISAEMHERFLGALAPHLEPGEEVERLAIASPPPKMKGVVAIQGQPALVAATGRRVLVLAIRYEKEPHGEGEGGGSGVRARIGGLFDKELVLDLVQEQEIASAHVKMGRALPGAPAKFEVGELRLQSAAGQKKDADALVETVRGRRGAAA